ncbi:hypothetical protein HKBW3S43_00953 [Candidatus Hakubella thermalkaliphila]|uniref:Uncharacterized protein n=2 Tax=Candidatus Hakubella thermalkaliphila TaxID=2754717 RepID=A0A6V8PWQ2_9ACTN|nr:hypothetical protein [Candidatus Hakubella thermalkaliphila]GFP27805.1 hypothetical protein HKBW3S33_01215 [Candidatus Hakubella thermalkaliphila]GFP35161.1 hypothetical protein HKBW3S43_00953 [Candidatus Hakubella thermalkaliphila]GFP42432.1 hypothetical protein HKBW3C_01557 [Candidatus Hakubella thermalkaliphila]
MPNERQLATLIWLGVFALLILLHPKGRAGVRNIAARVANLKIIIPIVALLVYLGVLVFVGWRVKWWTIDLTTDTVFWFFGSALVLLFNIDRVSKTERFFRQVVLGTVGVTALTEFFVNDLFVFSLPVELLLMPVLSVLVMISVLAGHEPRFRSVKRLVDSVLALVGISLVVYIGVRVVSGWDAIDKVDFALPLWLMIGVLPFIYVVSLYSNYERAFKWIDFEQNGGPSRWRAKLALVLRLHGQLRDISGFTMFWGKEIAATSTFREAWRVADKFRASWRERQRAEADKQDRLRRYAGVDGVDNEGRRLDQREFEETKAALQALATAQMGWYRNQGGRYRPELLEILESRFEHYGLPKNHGIELYVADDGQSWWAWRRTVTGWCFAIGAAGPPPDEWLFDGPHPPKRFPGQDKRWRHWGAGAKNW